MTAAPGTGRRTLRLAHRGDWRHAPENTVPALLAALDVPACDGLEFDVRLSADGIPVLLHDATLFRVQHVPRRADELDADALARYGVPRLDAALAAIAERRQGVWLDVELKGADHAIASADVLRAARGEAPADAVVSSFEAQTLRVMRDLLPGWPRWLNTPSLASTVLREAVDLGCSGVSAWHGNVEPSTLAEAAEAGLDVAAWTVRDLPTWERLANLGVVAVCVEAEALDG